MPFKEKTSKVGTFGLVEYDEHAKYPVRLDGWCIGSVEEARAAVRDLTEFLDALDGGEEKPAVPATSAYVGNASIEWRPDPRVTLDQPVRVRAWVRTAAWIAFCGVCAVLAVAFVAAVFKP